MRKDVLVKKIKGIGNYDFYPIFHRDKFIIKEIKSEYQLVLPNHQEVIVNSILMEIMNKCDGKNTILDIVQHITDEYEADENIVFEDVILSLYELWSVKIIVWSNANNPYLKLNELHAAPDLRYSVVGFSDIHDYMGKYLDLGISNSRYKSVVKFSDISIENSIKNHDMLYFSCHKDNKLQILIAYTPSYLHANRSITLSYVVDFIYVTKGIAITDSEVNDFFRWTLSFQESPPPQEALFEITIKKDKSEILENLKFRTLEAFGCNNYMQKIIQI